MQAQAAPLGPVTVGPPSWRDSTLRSIRRAERTVRLTRAGQGGPAGRPRSCTVPGAAPQPRATEDQTSQKEGGESHDPEVSRLETTGTMYPIGPKSPFVAPFPPPSLRERCAAASVRVASEYMRRVREVEGRLRGQASRVRQEATKLERERGHLEQVLRSLKCHLQVNRRSRECRAKRPSTTETERDGADRLLLREKQELAELTRDVEGTLRETLTQLQSLGQSSRQLLACSSERARVLELQPHSSSASAGRHSASRTFTSTDPTGPFTPECQQVLQSSARVLSQSQVLRDKIRRVLASAVARQEAAHQSVNDSLVKKIAETLTLKQNLTAAAAATGRAVNRKQREIDFIRHSQGRAQGPEYSGDLLTREKLNRPLVKVYQRHPGSQLPEAHHLIQGNAVLGRCLRASEQDLARLRGCCLQLFDNLHGKKAAAQVDLAVVRMRRQLVDKRAIPALLQQGAHRGEGR